jgi:hypothetical protein
LKELKLVLRRDTKYPHARPKSDLIIEKKTISIIGEFAIVAFFISSFSMAFKIIF